MEIVSVGPSEWAVGVEEATYVLGGEEVLTFAGEGVSSGSPALSLSVFCGGDGPRWCGEFFGGSEGCSMVVTGMTVAAAPVLLVVAGGVGYLVPAFQPANFEIVSLRPVREVRASPDAGVVVLVGYTELMAFGNEGELWSSGRLVWDGFTGVDIGAQVVVVRGFDAPSDRDVELTLDLMSGEVLLRS